ncbi:MAG: zinc-dependent metalloprotease [Myxococcota bacterium]
MMLGRCTLNVRFALLLAGLAIAAMGCTNGAATANRVQPNLVDKDMFEGEWWVTQTVIDANAEATGVTWTGDTGWDLSLDAGESGSLGRIRWVIDEDFLFAFRSYELVAGSNPDGNDENFRGQPLAAFEIIDHVDVRPQYNEVTGETRNVIEENTEDRRWFEREFMRVDWSENQVKSFFFPAELAALGGWTMEPGTFFIQDGSSHCTGGAGDEACDFPRSWEPQFVTVGEDPSYRFAADWPEGSEDTTHYMSFVTFASMSPGELCITTGGATCQSLSVPSRLAFLRVPPGHEYAAARQSHEEFDAFGVFRTEQRTYIGSNDRDNAQRCDRDEDCGVGGFCSPETRVCAGGLGEDFGETDALAFLRPRHNFFVDSLTDQACRADWECDGRFDGGGRIGGSACDRRARVCTIPMRDRTLRALSDGPGAVAFYLNEGFPKHLVHPAMEVMGDWNEVFMRGWRATRGVGLPDYASARVDCQTSDPTRYCFCGSPDDVGGTCQGRYDPFVAPDAWADRGVANPYDCYVSNTEFAEPESPTSFDDYPLPQAYRYAFVGEECMFVLRTNTCDWHRTDSGQACEGVLDADGEPVVWQQLGDLRYQFFNYIDQVNTPFGGVSTPLADPTTGELITANANFAAGSVERHATIALEFFPVLRCANDALGCDPGDEAAAERYLSGENLREYFSNLGRTEHPAGLAASGSDGFSVDDTSRPALPVNVNSALREVIERKQGRIERLRGAEGRAQILSDRMRRLEGTSIERQLMGSLGVDGNEALTRHFDHGQSYVFGLTPDISIYDDSVLDQVSPFRGAGFVRSLQTGNAGDDELSAHNICFSNESFFRRRYMEYWAEAFRGRPPAEASIRMQQLYTRQVQYHEVGHSVGLRHNFGASLDRDNYGNGYFNLVFGEASVSESELPLPRMEDYDLDDDDFVAGSEFDQYLEALRETRNQRARLGAHNYMSSSTMDYSGDMSDSQGLGRYDVAATIWNHFDQKEVYTASERDVETDDNGPFQGLKRSHTVGRTWWQSYLGGESCGADAECPYARESGAIPASQPVYQRCVQNPRNVFPQQGCSGQSDCVCSNFDEDVKDYSDLAAYPEAGADRNFAPVRYLFCPDERTNDISWCTRFDAGESFREVIDHYRRSWEELYPSNYYRRFLRGGARGGTSQRMVSDAAKIYQHLFFRLNFEPGFALNTGPLGFDDQFLASVDAMNWFIEIVNLPDEGSYAFDPTENRYRFMGEQIDLPGSDLSLLPGQGFGMWTKYQDGYFGFFRPERSGVFFDKFYALRALAIRDWGLSFTVDERYFINFYDLFQTEMTEFFGGVILQDESWFAPRLRMENGEPVVQHMSWYRGTALGECFEDDTVVPCRGSQRQVYPGASIEGTTNEVLRSWAAILALAQFPVYYDTSFEQRLLVFKAGSGSGFSIPDIQPDGSPTCVYGSDGLGAGHFVVDPDIPNGCDDAEDADYVVFESTRFRTPYVAVKIRPNLELNLEEEQVGFQLLKRLVDLQDELESSAPGEPGVFDKQQELQRGESFLEYLIELQTAYGISNFF